jgi:hypothetical protein
MPQHFEEIGHGLAAASPTALDGTPRDARLGDFSGLSD